MPQRDAARYDRPGLVCLCLCLGLGLGAVMATLPAGHIRAVRPAQAATPARTPVRCPFADATPAEATARSLGGAVRCLINRERRRRGLARVGFARSLERVARRFANDMRSRAYFGHVSPDGYGPRDRMRAAHMRAIGEVLAWGCGRLSTPAAAVRRWLHSPPHRQVVLSRAYTVTGTGVADGAPGQACGTAASTMVALFGRPR